ncbi:hypothetical protein ACVWXO_007684 [Bradyrhizobium sp. LM2.7]
MFRKKLFSQLAQLALSCQLWKPGFGRAPVPGTQEQAGALVDA